MKILLSENIKDILFKGKDLLPAQRKSVFASIIDMVQTIPDTAWIKNPDEFMEDVIFMHPNVPTGYYTLVSAMHRHLHPVYIANLHYGVVVENIIFNCDIDIITVIVNTRYSIANIFSQQLRSPTNEGIPDEADLC